MCARPVLRCNSPPRPSTPQLCDGEEILDLNPADWDLEMRPSPEPISFPEPDSYLVPQENPTEDYLAFAHQPDIRDRDVTRYERFLATRQLAAGFHRRTPGFTCRAFPSRRRVKSAKRAAKWKNQHS